MCLVCHGARLEKRKRRLKGRDILIRDNSVTVDAVYLGAVDLSQRKSQLFIVLRVDGVAGRCRICVFVVGPAIGSDRASVAAPQALGPHTRFQIGKSLSFNVCHTTLTNQARSTYFGKSCWSSSGIVSILRNERHCGDVLTRKTVTENYRTHRTLKNRGEKPQSRYYNHHDAIIRRDDFNAVQRMLDNAKYGNKSILPELRVIHDGLLKGFVSINPRWSGFKEGDYLSASRSAYTDIPTDGAPSQIPADATFAVNAGDFDLRGFEITRTEFLGTHSQPFVTFADKKVKFSAACVRHFGAKRYVELLINPLEMKFAVRPTDSSNRSGVIISSNYSGKPQPREISAAAFSDTIFHLFGWNTACKYRINGILCEDAGQLVYIFDVADSETFIRSQELSVRAASTNEETIHPLSTLGKHVRAIPEQWVGTFGKEFYLHECSLSALEHMTRSNWSLNLQGQLFETGKKLHVTDFDELRQYIMKELGGTMPQEDRNGNME